MLEFTDVCIHPCEIFLTIEYEVASHETSRSHLSYGFYSMDKVFEFIKIVHASVSASTSLQDFFHSMNCIHDQLNFLKLKHFLF